MTSFFFNECVDFYYGKECKFQWQANKQSKKNNHNVNRNFKSSDL